MTEDNPFDALRAQVEVLEATLTLYAEQVDKLIQLAGLEQPQRNKQHERELRALEHNGAWRTPSQEERFQALVKELRRED